MNGNGGNGLSEFERMEIIRRKAEIMEKRAEREEQLLRAKRNGNSDVDELMAVNDRYIDAISAKLKILDQI